MKNLINMKKTDNKGFTLVEIAIVIVIGAFIWLALLKAYTTYLEQQAVNKTRTSIERIEAGLAAFFRTNGRYPCPADPTLGPDNINYGLEAAGCAGLDPEDSAAISNAMPWFDNPFRSNRDANNDGNTSNDYVVYGSVPFRTIEPCIDNPNTITCNLLPLEESYTLDAWGDKFTYAITARLMTNDFNNSLGALGVEDEFKQSVIEPPYSAHYAIISHGPNRYGAFTRDGAQIQSECTPSLYTGPPLPVLPVSMFWNEKENCDYTDALIVSGLLNTSDNEYYDDIVVFNKSSLSQLWRTIQEGEIVNNNDGFVGIGNFNETDEPTAELHIRGDMKTSDLLADRICDYTGAHCYVPEFFGGPQKTTYGGTGSTDPTDYQNTCADPSMAIVEIRENHVRCDPVYTSVIPGQCPPNQVMIGYNNTTGIICGPLP